LYRILNTRLNDLFSAIEKEKNGKATKHWGISNAKVVDSSMI